MGHKTIPYSAEACLESFYPPFVAGIDLPHQGVVDSYNLLHGDPYTSDTTSLDWNGPGFISVWPTHSIFSIYMCI